MYKSGKNYKIHEKFVTSVEKLWITSKIPGVANFRVLIYSIIKNYFGYCPEGHPCWHAGMVCVKGLLAGMTGNY